MVITAPKKSLAGEKKVRTRKDSGTRCEKKTIRRRKGMNVSRKQVLAVRQEKFHLKLAERKAKARAEKLASRRVATRQQNKKSNRSFDAVELKCVQEGLIETIKTLGEPVTPLALAAAAMTAITRATSKGPVPYLLSIVAAAIPHLRQPVLLHQSRSILAMLRQVLEEQHQDNLILSKVMKCAQELFLSIDVPTDQTMQLVRSLEPSKLHPVLVPQFLTLFRKVLQQCALRKYTVIFLAHLPSFVALCTSMFSGAPVSSISAATSELLTLVRKTFSPQLVEEGHHILNGIVRESLVELFKPHFRDHWLRACSIVETFFSHLSFLKRSAIAGAALGPMSGSARFLSWFTSARFLLQVLNKIRHVEDSQLNSAVERAIVAIGMGMSVRDFVQVLPFDPRKSVDVHSSDLDAFWKNSYTFGVIRRIASHDDLTFFREYFLPIAKHAEEMTKEAQLGQRLTEAAQWNALWIQAWRIGVGFFHYPLVVTDESFREIAKALVGLLSTSLVDTAATAFDAISSGYFRLSKAVSNEDDNDDDEVKAAMKEEDHTRESLDENEAYLNMHDDGWNTHVFHNISQQEAERVCTTILARYSSNIMPRLCNVYETHESTALLSAISSYSKVSSASVMNSIVKGILDVGLAIQSEEEHYISPKRRMILSIASAVIPQLSTEHLEALLTTLVEPVLSDPSPTSRLLQKKAYKLLYAMFEHRMKDIFPHFTRVMQLLVVSQQHVTVSGIKMRIKCLSWAIDACKIYRPELMMDAVKTCIGEVVLCAREQNSEVRDMAMEVLEKMQRYITANGQHSHSTLLQMVLSGLSGQTGLLMSSTIVCLAKLVWVSHEHLTHRELKSVISIGARLLESSITEVRTAAANFARMVFNLSKRSELVAEAARECLPQITQAIALTTSQQRVSSSTRVMMRVLLEKCIKRFTFEAIEKIFPIGSKKFLFYTNKILRREERNQVKEIEEKNVQTRDEFKDLFQGAMKANAETGADDETTDLLQEGALANFIAHHSALPFNHTDDNDSDDGEDMCMTFESDGKIRILSKTEKKKEDEEKKRHALAEKLLRKNKGAITAASFDEPRSGKRGRDDEDVGRRRGRGDDVDDDDQDVANDELILRYGSTLDADAARSRTAQFTASGGASLKLHNEKLGLREAKRQRLEQDIKKGEEYTTGRGEGDVKRGKIDPFAYVPLNRRFINRRHRRQAVQRFDAVNYKVLKGNKSRRFGDSSSKGK